METMNPGEPLKISTERSQGGKDVPAEGTAHVRHRRDYPVMAINAVERRSSGRDQANTVSAALERHYTVAEVAKMWNLSKDVIRELFAKEPGVLVVGDTAGRRGKRRYRTMRIPESVFQRVHRRLSIAA
ncbi:MAG TPA: hypothetical protein VN442_00605 [Bryobacteraceae bacterium]|nr:hypothetical protein [Bryobacteraceae bacterium]